MQSDSDTDAADEVKEEPLADEVEDGEGMMFPGSSISVVVACFLVIDQMQRSGMAATRMEEWWDLLCTLLPTDHALPPFNKARSLITSLAAIRSIDYDVCLKDCVIYRNRPDFVDPTHAHHYADPALANCPVCGGARFKVNGKPTKIFSWLGINDQLKARLWFSEWQDAIQLSVAARAQVLDYC